MCIKGKTLPILTLQEIWFALHAANCLLSVPTLTKQGYRCEITYNASWIWNPKEQLVIQASALSPMNNLHWFQSIMITPINGVLSSVAKQDLYDLWHTCYRYLGPPTFFSHSVLPTVPLSMEHDNQRWRDLLGDLGPVCRWRCSEHCLLKKLSPLSLSSSISFSFSGLFISSSAWLCLTLLHVIMLTLSC